MGGFSGFVFFVIVGEDDVVSRVVWFGFEDECLGLKEEVFIKLMFGNKVCICFDVIFYILRFRCFGFEGRRFLWEVSSLFFFGRWVGIVFRGDIFRAVDFFFIFDLLYDFKT